MALSSQQAEVTDKRFERLEQAMQRYIDEGIYAGILTLVARKGEIIHHKGFGYQDLASKKKLKLDTIFRIYSMTKPVTAVALMMLHEQDLFRLSDPVSKFIPEFKGTKVLRSDGQLIDLNREITILHLMLHTAGMIYESSEDDPLIKLYTAADIFDPKITIEEMVHRVAGLPLKFQPGEEFYYSISMDVIGRVIEVIAGMSLDQYFEKNIFEPLGMVDTGFSVPDKKRKRFATLYGRTEAAPLGLIDDEIGGEYFDVNLFCGGSGLVSTTSDYFRFAQCLLSDGELDGVRLLRRKTVERMRANHLEPELLPIDTGEDPYPGLGFGLGFAVMLDPTQSEFVGSVGSYGWGGWASTYWWNDPSEELLAILMIQYIPSSSYPIRKEIRELVYQAIGDRMA